MLIPFHELWTKYEIQADGVLHIGANTGQEAEAYASQGIKRVVWIEAHPVLCQKLRRNVAAYPGHTVLQACVGDEDGKPVEFHVASNNGQSSSVLQLGTHATVHPEVKYVNHLKMTMARVDTLLAAQGITLEGNWFLNIDVQGAELMVLRGMDSLLHHFSWAYIEVNEDELYVGCPHTKEIDVFLVGHGLTGKETKMSGNHGWGDKFYVRFGSAVEKDDLAPTPRKKKKKLNIQ